VSWGEGSFTMDFSHYAQVPAATPSSPGPPDEAFADSQSLVGAVNRSE